MAQKNVEEVIELNSITLGEEIDRGPDDCESKLLGNLAYDAERASSRDRETLRDRVNNLSDAASRSNKTAIQCNDGRDIHAPSDCRDDDDDAERKCQSSTRRSVPGTTTPTLLNFGDYYPDGGWGWVVCSAACIVHSLAIGLVYSYGTIHYLLVEKHHLKQLESVWLGSVNHALVLMLSSFVTCLCRRKSVRLLAVVGGILSALGCLFVSFSSELYQLAISYSCLYAVGAGVIVTTAEISIARFFNEKRELAEIAFMSAPGFGMIIISAILLREHRVLGWMRSLQIMAGLFFITFIAGLLYRSATIYHPRRKVILQIKSTKRPKNVHTPYKLPYLDFRCLRVKCLQCVMLASSVCAFGAHVPLSLSIRDAGLQLPDQTWTFIYPLLIGLSYVVGVLVHGYFNVHRALVPTQTRQFTCQITAFLCGLVTMLIPHGRSFTAHSLRLTTYGLALGAYQFGIKMLVYDLMKVKAMDRAWSMVKLAQSITTVIGPVCAVYLSSAYETDPEMCCIYGYYLSGASMILGSLILFLLHFTKNNANDTYYLQLINAEPHHSDVTVAVIPQTLGLAQQDLLRLKYMPVNILHSRGNPVIMVNDADQTPPAKHCPAQSRERISKKQVRYDRLKHKTLNKLLQELNGNDSGKNCIRAKSSLSSTVTSPCRHPSYTSRVSTAPSYTSRMSSAPSQRQRKSSLKQAGTKSGHGRRSVSFTTSSPEVSLTSTEHSSSAIK